MGDLRKFRKKVVLEGFDMNKLTNKFYVVHKKHEKKTCKGWHGCQYGRPFPKQRGDEKHSAKGGGSLK